MNTGECWDLLFIRIKQFNETYFPGWWNHPLVNFSNALAGETGEVCGVVKALLGGGTKKKPVTVDDIARELVDVFIYLILFAQRLGLGPEDFKEMIFKKIYDNEQRMQFRGGK